MKSTNLNTDKDTNKNLLNKMYGQIIRKTIENIDEDQEIRLETYDLILYELKRESNYKTYEEIKYRITDGEPPNNVFYDIILRGDYSSSLIWLFKKRIEEFIEIDSYERFYK